MYFLGREWDPVFYLFIFLLSHIFPENVIIKIPQFDQKIWRFFTSILALSIYFLNFFTFSYYKETNGVTYNRWCQQFFTFNLLLIGCLTLLTFMFVPDVVTWVKISFKCACDQEEVVQLGYVSREFGCHAGWSKAIVVNLGYFSA